MNIDKGFGFQKKSQKSLFRLPEKPSKRNTAIVGTRITLSELGQSGLYGVKCRKSHCHPNENPWRQLVSIRCGSNGAILAHITELSAHTLRYEEIRVKDRENHHSSRRNKSVVGEYSGQHASFPILNSGKASAPFYDRFRNIIHLELLPI